MRSAMACLHFRGARAVELLAQLPDQFALGPCQAVIIGRDREDTLFLPALALDLLGIPAFAAVAFRMPPHATPPFVSIAQRRMAMASASLSSAGEKPRARTAAMTAALSALPLAATCRLIVPIGTPSYGTPRSSAHAVSVAMSPP